MENKTKSFLCKVLDMLALCNCVVDNHVVSMEVNIIMRTNTEVLEEVKRLKELIKSNPYAEDVKLVLSRLHAMEWMLLLEKRTQMKEFISYDNDIHKPENFVRVLKKISDLVISRHQFVKESPEELERIALEIEAEMFKETRRSVKVEVIKDGETYKVSHVEPIPDEHQS